MGILAKLDERRGSLENPNTPLSKAADWLTGWSGGGKTAAGVSVNEHNALRSTAVFGCIRIIAETIASLPLPVYRRLDPRGKERAPDHPLYRLLHDRPNPYMSSFTFRETLAGHCAGWGNGYAEIERDTADRPIALWPLPPDRTEPKWRGEKKVYTTQVGTEQVVLGANDVLHIPGLGFDGIKGYSPIQLARQAVGLTLATEEFGARWFGNGSRLSGVLEHPGKLGEDASKNLRTSWNEMHQGLSAAHRVAILEEGMNWKAIGVPPEDAQFLETRKFQTTEVARLFRVPPHLLGDLERATFSNIEQQSLEFVIHTIRPWLVRWEQVLNHDLFSERDRGSYFTEFLVDGLLRGDTESRYTAYQTGRQWGWLSADDVRELENMNPLPGGQGDQYLVPLNMIPADKAAQMPASTDTPPEEDERSAEPEERRVIDLKVERRKRSITARQRAMMAMQPMFREAAEVIVSRETNAARRAIKKYLGQRSPEQFDAWLDDFYATHGEFILRRMAPVIRSLAEMVQAEAADEVGAAVGLTPDIEQFLGEYGGAFSARMTGSSKAQLGKILRDTSPEEVEAALEARLAEWEGKRADKIADREPKQLGNAVARLAYMVAGVTVLRWNTVGRDCPLCNLMEGRVVSITRAFVEPGDTLDPKDGQTAPLTAEQRFTHPPLHRGCDCMVSAG